jgi:hypothetical protein
MTISTQRLPAHIPVKSNRLSGSNSHFFYFAKISLYNISDIVYYLNNTGVKHKWNRKDGSHNTLSTYTVSL